MSKVCVFLAKGFEEVEALTVVDLLRRSGIDTDMISVTKERMVTGAHDITVETDMSIESVDFSLVDMLVLPGGIPGATNLANCETLMHQLDKFHQQKKYISAICAAPGILGERGILEGKRACSYPDKESLLKGAAVTRNTVEMDGHIITSRGLGTAIDFSLSIIARLKGQEAADVLAKKIVYNN